jgi:Amt family ammonium transporter
LPGGAEVKIVAVTASVLMEHREGIMASGCDDLVHKPFRDHEIFDAMARHLGVQYLYRERGRETGRDQDTKLTPDMLAELPGELLQELRRATLVLDRETTMQVIERIKVHAPQTAESLQNMVEGLQMGKLGELLEALSH